MRTLHHETFYFEDNGNIPNNKLPLLLYRRAFDETGNSGAEWLEKTFKGNNWYNGWRNGIYPYHHYHSNTAEVLGVYSGSAKVLFGGNNGQTVHFSQGDIVIIPPGVGHKCLSQSNDFKVVGAYPDGKEPDLFRGEDGERPQADENIAKTPIPTTDPLSGEDGALVRLWINSD